MDFLHTLFKKWTVGQRFLITAALLFALGTVIHGIAWVGFGGPMIGPVSWRKPILFCLASGVTCASLAWVLGLLPRSSINCILASVFSVSILGEVALICLQQWRGVASHFNSMTDLDASVLLAIKCLAIIFSATIVLLACQTIFRAAGKSDTVLAAKAGMFFLVVACALGFVIEIQGERQLAKGDSPTEYLEAGVLKFAHGMPMHAIQVLPMVSLVLIRLGIDERLRVNCMWAMISGFSLLTLYALAQTFRGRARLDLDPLSGGIMLAAILCFSMPVVLTLAQWRKKTMQVS